MTNAPLNARLALRQRAESEIDREVSGTGHSSMVISAQTTMELIHELEVHHIELEMQNEELIRAYIELDAAKARYFDLYDLAPIGYCTLDGQGVVLEANLAAASLLDIPRSGLVSKPFHRFVAHNSQDTYYFCIKALAASEKTQDCELQVAVQAHEPDTPAPWVHMRLSAVPTSEGETAMRVVFHDISERKRLEAENEANSVELQRAWQLAETANRAKSDFLSSMTHELRSPLNAMLGFAQLLNMSEPPLTGNQKSSVDQIVQAGWYLLDLVNEVLDLSLVESGKVAIALVPVSLADMLLDCQAMMEPLARKRGIQIHFKLPPPGWQLLADKTRLKQIFVNLLTNAIQYNRPHGRIDVTCIQRSPELVRITVVDTGDGLSVDKLSQLFQPFNRLDRQYHDQEGTGIGLVISKHLVELMGGTMGADSSPGIGSRFWFELTTPPAAVDLHG